MWRDSIMMLSLCTGIAMSMAMHYPYIMKWVVTFDNGQDMAQEAQVKSKHYDVSLT